MNAVMPGHSPQFASPYGNGLADGVDQDNAHYNGNNAASSSTPRNSMNGNANGETLNSSNPENGDRHMPMSAAAAQQQQPPQPMQQSPSQQLTPPREPVSSPMEAPAPFGLGNQAMTGNSHFIQDLVADSYPWSIGSTDGCGPWLSTTRDLSGRRFINRARGWICDKWTGDGNRDQSHSEKSAL